MLVYIDNNILIDFEDGKKDLPLNDAIKYVYSYVHLQELQESKELETKKNQRFQTIEKLTSNRYVCYNNNNQLALYKAKPINIFAIIDNYWSKMISCHIHKTEPQWDKIDENSKLIMEKLGIEKKVINNYTPEMLMNKYGFIIKRYIEYTCFNRQEMFQSLFNILNILGYWQDELKSGSFINRLYDANHAFYATSCDLFVTNDRKAKIKANVAYKSFKYRTKALDYDEFANLIKNIP